MLTVHSRIYGDCWEMRIILTAVDVVELQVSGRGCCMPCSTHAGVPMPRIQRSLTSAEFHKRRGIHGWGFAGDAQVVLQAGVT